MNTTRLEPLPARRKALLSPPTTRVSEARRSIAASLFVVPADTSDEAERHAQILFEAGRAV